MPGFGVHLLRTEQNVAQVDALAAHAGGRPGLPALLDDLNRRGHRTWAPGRYTRHAFTWDAADRRTTDWWPQGITTSADASPSGRVHGRRLVATTWYSKVGQGSRLSVVDLETLRYRHVLLVEPTTGTDGRPGARPLAVHAGGVVWCQDHIHVAATARGLVTFRIDDLLWVPDGSGLETFGHRWILPVRFAYEGVTDEGHERLRYSFLSLDRQAEPPQLVAGEYARGDRSRRLVRYDVDPATGLLASGEDGTSHPLGVDEDGLHQMQGAVAVAGRLHLTVSHGPWVPGSLYVGRPGAFVRHRWATPMGPEDVAAWPDREELWSLSEHPRRRWVYAVPLRLLD